jgi:hypothetical protein
MTGWCWRETTKGQGGILCASNTTPRGDSEDGRRRLGRTDGASLCYGLITSVDINFRVARQNEAARAADATACIDTSVGTLLNNGWRRG